MERDGLTKASPAPLQSSSPQRPLGPTRRQAETEGVLDEAPETLL